MKIPRPEYGSISSSVETENGTIDKVKSYQNRTLIAERWTYRERYRVRSITTADAKYDELTRRIRADRQLIDPSIQVIGRDKLAKRGYIDLILTYTRDMMA